MQARRRRVAQRVLCSVAHTGGGGAVGDGEGHQRLALRRVERRARVLAAVVLQERRARIGERAACRARVAASLGLLHLLKALKPLRPQHAVVECVPVHLLVPLGRVEAAEAGAVACATLASAAATCAAIAGQLLRERANGLAQRLEGPRTEERQIFGDDTQSVNRRFEVIRVDVAKHCVLPRCVVVVNAIVVVAGIGLGQSWAS